MPTDDTLTADVAEMRHLQRQSGFTKESDPALLTHSEKRFVWLAANLAPRLADALDAMRQENEALARFKKWVHDYLDTKGIPHHPPGVHGAEGCRIGDRMDHLFADVDRLRQENERLREALDWLTRIGQDPAHMAPHLCGLPDRWERLVDTLVNAAAAALEGRDDGRTDAG